MRTNVTSLAFPVVLAAAVATATGQDLRLVTAAANQDTQTVQALLAEGVDVNTPRADGATAARRRSWRPPDSAGPYTLRGEPRGVRSASAEEAVRLLVEAGADVNAVNEADFTALHGATFRGLNEVIEYLVAQGADIDARDFRGRTGWASRAPSRNACATCRSTPPTSPDSSRFLRTCPGYALRPPATTRVCAGWLPTGRACSTSAPRNGSQTARRGTPCPGRRPRRSSSLRRRCEVTGSRPAARRPRSASAACLDVERNEAFGEEVVTRAAPRGGSRNPR